MTCGALAAKVAHPMPASTRGSCMGRGKLRTSASLCCWDLDQAIETATVFKSGLSSVCLLLPC
jgi:hypothetical protein